MSISVGGLAYSLATSLFVLLIFMQLRTWKTGNSSLMLLVSTSISLIWTLALLLQHRISPSYFYLIPALEIFKNLIWFSFLLSILGGRKLLLAQQGTAANSRELSVVTLITIGVPLYTLAVLVYVQLGNVASILQPDYGGTLLITGFLISAVAGLTLLEQVIRNTRQHHQWHLKYICMGLGVMFSYDIFLYSDALLFNRVQVNLWDARGIALVTASPLLALGVRRTRQQPIQLNISRRLVFHTGVIFAAGIYLLVMALAGYYIRSFPGEWGVALQAIFWLASLTLLVSVIYSGRLRSYLKVYISRNLFSSKYDYREEWMRISRTLSGRESSEPLPERAIQAMLEIVDSPAGGLWVTTDGTYFDQIAQIEMGWVKESGLAREDYLIDYLADKKRVVDLHNIPENLEPAKLPEWVLRIPKVWLIIPLELQGDLIGFVILKESRVELELNWEDFDLFKAAGQQTASYLAQMIASQALSEANQFNAFNQASAFVIHDIKTLNSQLSMLVRNAEIHKSNPEFIEDMISTTEHAVKKMDFLLGHFKSREETGRKSSLTDLVKLVNKVVGRNSKSPPVPIFLSEVPILEMEVNAAELESGIEHLIKNAQEATPVNGDVNIHLSLDGNLARLVVSDTGSGMTQEFIQTRLFKPFDSTKGVVGMGVGVFQSRNSIRKMGGNLEVKSEPGQGTEFTITLPITD